MRRSRAIRPFSKSKSRTHGNVERAPGRRHAHEAAAIGSRESGDEHHAIAVDERLVGLQRHVGKGMEERLIDLRDRLAPARQSPANGLSTTPSSAWSWASAADVAADPGVLEARDQLGDLVSGHG